MLNLYGVGIFRRLSALFSDLFRLRFRYDLASPLSSYAPPLPGSVPRNTALLVMNDDQSHGFTNTNVVQPAFYWLVAGG
jgi:hypothetical protein